MTDTTTIAHGAEAEHAPYGRTAFSYCCECGTYDAHARICTCCGFDFSSESGTDEAE